MLKLSWGITLLVLVLFNLRNFSFIRIRPEGVIATALFLAWALLLIVFPARKLWRIVGNRDTKPMPPERLVSE